MTPIDQPRRKAPSYLPQSVESLRRPNTASRMGIRWSLLLCGLLIGGAAAAFAAGLRYDFLLGQITVVLFAVCAAHGVWRGGFRKLVMLVVLITWLATASHLPAIVQSLLKRAAGGSSLTATYLIVGLAGLAAYLLVGKSVKSFRRKVILPRPRLLALDRFTGMLIGGAEGLLIVIAICWTALTLQPQARQFQKQGAFASVPMLEAWLDGLDQLAAEADREPWGPTISANNPLRDMPAVQDWLMRRLNVDQKAILNRTGPRPSDPSNAGMLSQLAGVPDPRNVRQMMNERSTAVQAQNDQARQLLERHRAAQRGQSR